MESTHSIFSNFHYIDPVQERIQRDVFMLVTDGRVEKIQQKPFKKDSIPVIDLLGQYVTPGFINNINCNNYGTYV